MPYVTYTAHRNLAGSHTVDTIYSIEFPISALSRSTKSERDTVQSLGGRRVTTLTRFDISLAIRTGVIHKDNLPNWREFLHSVAAGEVFTFDDLGTVAVPVAPVNTVLTSSDWTEAREEFTDYFRFSFNLGLV